MNSKQNDTDKTSTPIFILAGGLGTRISEETSLKPKPMIEVGEAPVLLHLMRWYYSFGFNDFVICAGYKAWEIKKFFLSYEMRANHLEIDHRESLNNPPRAIGKNVAQEHWRVRVIDTGLETMTGARVARAYDFVSKEQKIANFGLTYGDGLCDVNLDEEWAFHLNHKKLGTVMGVRMTARFGELDHNEQGLVQGFLEKPESKQGLINGGFFFFSSDFRSYLDVKQDLILERKPLEKLATDNQLMMYQHNGFWQPMDTLRDKIYLQSLWDGGKAPWKTNKKD